MTISALWRSGSYAYICSDTAESGRADTRFPISSFDEPASASILNAQEMAMKLVQVGSHGLAAASGDGRVARLIMDQLEAMDAADLDLGVEQSLATAATRAGLTAASARDASWLCAEWRDGRLSTFRWPRDCRDSECGRAGALLAGNLTKELADGFCSLGARSLDGLAGQRSAGAVLPATAELSLIAATFQAVILAEGLSAARGIGGTVVTARVGPEGVQWMPDTLYIVGNPDVVRRLASGTGGDVSLADLSASVVCLSVREGCMFLRSTGPGDARVLVPGEEKRAARRWRARWEDEVRRPSFWLGCQTVVFVNPVQRSITAIFGDFTEPNRLLGLAIDESTGALATDWRAGLSAHLIDTARPDEPWRLAFDVVAPFALGPS